MIKKEQDIFFLNGLYWENKVEEVEKQIQNSRLSLKKIPSKSIGKQGNLHRIIEGDNLAGLQILLNKNERFDLIYIDPPYNTGNKDFKYNDTFVDLDDENRHSKWSSFIFKRLQLAHQLLNETGAIFISIDDAEQARLKLICDGVFGQSNFVANFIRKNKAGSGHDSKQIAVEYDYMLCYAKNLNKLELTQQKVNTNDDPKYRLSDQFSSRRGKYYLRDLQYKGSYSESLDYEIECPDGTKIFPGNIFGKPHTWRWSKSKFDWGVKNDFIVFKQKEAQWKVYIKQYQFVDNKNQLRTRKLPHRAFIEYINSKGSTELKNILDQDIFSYPKPLELLEFVIHLLPSKDIKILDFFAGSGTTLHATASLNYKDKGSRQCTLITNNENRICEEVTFMRTKKVFEGYIDRRKKKVKELSGNKLDYFKISFD